MISVLILSFLTGALLITGLPHLVRGAAGKKHQTLLGKPTTAVQNVIWGWVLISIGVIVWHFAPMASHPRAAFVGTAAGVLAMGITLATTASKN